MNRLRLISSNRQRTRVRRRQVGKAPAIQTKRKPIRLQALQRRVPLVAAERVAAEKVAAEKVAAEKVVAEKVVAEKVVAEKVPKKIHRQKRK